MNIKQLIKIFSAVLFFSLAHISININGQNTFNLSSSVLAPDWDDIDIGKVDAETPVPVILNSIQKDSIESNVDYFSLNSWDFYTTDKKETHGVYELIVIDSDFEN